MLDYLSPSPSELPGTKPPPLAPQAPFQLPTPDTPSPAPAGEASSRRWKSPLAALNNHLQLLMLDAAAKLASVLGGGKEEVVEDPRDFQVEASESMSRLYRAARKMGVKSLLN